MTGGKDLFGTFDEFKEDDHKRDKNGRSNGNDSTANKTNNKINKKIESITRDWSEDNTLPNLNKKQLEQYRLVDKPVLLKR